MRKDVGTISSFGGRKEELNDIIIEGFNDNIKESWETGESQGMCQYCGQL